MYIQLQLKTEVVCIEEEENRDKYGIRFCKCFKNIFYINNIFYFMEDMYTKRSEESKKGIKIYMRVRSKKE